jgi:hypothetical protein
LYIIQLYSETITSLSLSLSSSALLLGTSTGQIQIHAIPSLQHLRTISPAAHKGCPVTHLSTFLKPSDLHGLERMRVGRGEREKHEVLVNNVGDEEDVSSDLLSAGYPISG